MLGVMLLLYGVVCVYRAGGVYRLPLGCCSRYRCRVVHQRHRYRESKRVYKQRR